jgi:hypothetical protein
MKTCDALRRLADLQDRISAALDKAGALARDRGQGAQGDLARQRWETMRLLREYQLFKHVELFDPAIAAGGGDRAALAGRMKARCLAAGADFTAFVEQWSAAAIERGWPGYVAALLRMIDSLHAHVGRERQEVAMLLDGTTDTRLRPPARVPSG